MLKKISNLLTKFNDFLLVNTGKLLLTVFWGCLAYLIYDIAYLGNWQTLLWYPFVAFIGWVVISAFYHRALAHPSWECPDWLKYPFAFFAPGLGVTPAIVWCSLHREHHRHSDIKGKDPHGPAYSWWKNLHILLYNPKFMYSKNLLRDPLLVAQMKQYWSWFLISVAFFISVFGASVWALMVVALTATQISINMLGHYPIGQERKENIKQHILSLIYTPEIYHGQHHDTPNRAKLGAFDVVYYTLIRFFPHKS